MTSISTSTPTTDAAMTALPLGVVLARSVRKGMGNRGQLRGLDLRVEDVLEGLDALGANLAGELHREARALDRHDGRRGVRRLAGRELLRGGGGVLLHRVELADLLGERAAEAGARGGGGRAGAGAVDGADRAALPVGAVHGEGGIDRHQRRRSRVLVNICLLVCMAVTFASYERDALIRSTISVTGFTFGIET